jgi:hypothetical protein
VTRGGGRTAQIALLVSGAVFCFSAIVALAQLVGADRIARSNGCGFDGTFYCAMLRGETVPEPFSRRVLLAFLAKRVETDGLAGFWVVGILSLLATVAVTMFVAWRLRPASSPAIAYRLVPALLVGATVLSARNTFHLMATYPALSDPLGLFLLVAVVALVVAPRRPSTQLLLLPVCFLAPLAREELAPVIAVSLVLAAAMRLTPWLVAIAASAASGAGAAVAFSQPDTGAGRCTTASGSVVDCPSSVASTIHFWLDWDFGSWDGLFRFVVMLLIAFGPFVLLAGAVRPRSYRSPAVWIFAVAAIFTVASIFSGGDTDRLLTPAGLLLALALAVALARSEEGLLALSVGVVAWVIAQDPLHAVGSDDTSWLSFFGLRIASRHSVVHNGLVPALIALPLGVAAAWLVASDRSPPTAPSAVVAVPPGRTALGSRLPRRLEMLGRVAGGTAATLIGSVGAVVFVLSWVAIHYGFFGWRLPSDTLLYEAYGDAAVQGRVPYRDFAVDYPPGSLAVFVAPSLSAGAGHLSAFEHLFEGLMVVCGLAVVGLVASLQRLWQASVARLSLSVGLVALSPFLLGAIMLSRYDLWPAMLTAAAIAAFAWHRDRLGFPILAVAIATKLFAAFLTPLALAYCWRRRGLEVTIRHVGAFAATLALCFGPFVVLAPHGVWTTISREFSRPLQVETLGSSLLLAAHQVAGTSVTVDSSYGSQNLVGTAPHVFSILTTTVVVVVLIAIVLLFLRGPASPAAFVLACAATLCTVVAFGKVLSAQFLIWLIPLVPMVRGVRGLAGGALLAAAMVLTQVVVPHRYYALVFELAPTETWLLVARDAVLVVLAVYLVVATGATGRRPMLGASRP